MVEVVVVLAFGIVNVAVLEKSRCVCGSDSDGGIKIMGTLACVFLTWCSNWDQFLYVVPDG